MILRMHLHWYNRGAVNGKLGRHEEAIVDLDEAIRLDPENAFAWYNRGAVKAHLQDFDGAAKDVEKAVYLSPPDSEIWNSVAAMVKAEQAAREANEGL